MSCIRHSRQTGHPHQKPYKWMQLVAYGPKRRHYHRRGLLMPGWMEPLFEAQNSILIRKPGNTHVKCRKLSQCRNPRHIWHGLKLGMEEEDLNDWIWHSHIHLKFPSCSRSVYRILGEMLRQGHGFESKFPSWNWFFGGDRKKKKERKSDCVALRGFHRGFPPLCNRIFFRPNLYCSL